MFNIGKCIVILTLLTIAWSYENDSAFPVKKSKLTSKSKEKVLVLNKPIKNFTLKIPRNCEELGICEHIPNYPQQIVWKIIKKLLRRNITFNTDVKLWEDYADYFFEDSPRIHEDEDLCKSKHKLYFPEAARDVSQRWRLILNSPRTPQNFIGDQCESNDQDCSKMAYFMTPLYRGVCVQKFMKRVMYGLNEELNGVIKTLFEVPSCCVCMARRIS